jgi:AbrB family looped-hinge helix DNA binding protein
MIKDPNQKGKYVFGVCKVGEKGQIVIPKDARTIFNIQPGDSLILFGDETKGLALVKTDVFQDLSEQILKGKDKQ